MARKPAADSEATRRADWPALQIRIARIRLRTGSLYTARAELETLAAREQLDTPAHLDLAEANRRRLMEAGITPQRIYASNLCTMCRGEEFHSFRRDKEAAGRLYSFAGILQAVH